MPATLYALRLSHPAHAVRLMLERKGLEHQVSYLPAGLHPPLVRAAGFRGLTVPALKIDGRRVQGSREIAAALDEIEPRPPLFPPDPDRRRMVEAAEEWGERELQAVPRRLLRWGARNRLSVRRWIGADVDRMPLAGVAARMAVPVTVYFARVSGVSDEAVRADLERLPALLDEVERLIEAGTIGGEDPNAADYQIATSVRLLLAFEDLEDAIEGRPATEHAMRLFPAFRHRVPRFLPQPWLRHLR